MTTQIQKADQQSTLERYRRHVNAGFAVLADFMALPVEAHSEGSVIVDTNGETYLDCGGYGVFILGHRHPAVVQSVREQLERHALSSRALLNASLAEAAECVASAAPVGLDYVCFTNSGAEATEAGLKLARLNGRNRFISMDGGFHGKTLGALSVTGRPRYQTPFRDLLMDVVFVPFGDLDALERQVRVEGERTCVIVEPVQAEAGVIVPPAGYLRQLNEICRRNGAFVIVDEIQTGLGRLGWWWGCDREDIVPDVLLVGKALGGGVLPVGAAVTTPAAYAALNRDPLLHTSTFAGNPLAMAAVQAALATIEREHIVGKARMLGQRLLQEIRAIVEGVGGGTIRDVRGMGLLIGLEFETEDLAGEFMIELMHRNIIVSHSLNSNHVVRLTPPAILTEAQVGWLLDAVDEACRAVCRIAGSTSAGGS
jgi:putrescine aminotransferase